MISTVRGPTCPFWPIDNRRSKMVQAGALKMLMPDSPCTSDVECCLLCVSRAHEASCPHVVYLKSSLNVAQRRSQNVEPAGWLFYVRSMGSRGCPPLLRLAVVEESVRVDEEMYAIKQK